MDIVNRYDIPIRSKRFGNELEFMVVHFDLIHQVVSLLLHVAHKLLQEYPFVINP